MRAMRMVMVRMVIRRRIRESTFFGCGGDWKVFVGWGD